MTELSDALSRKEMLARCARDRDDLFAELYALRPQFAEQRPSKFLKAAIRTVCGFRVAPRVLFPGQLALCDFQSKIVYYNSNLESFVNQKTSLAGLVNSSLAHELGHIRLHTDEMKSRHTESYHFPDGQVTHVDNRDFQREQEADLYAAVFLVPGRFLVQEKSAQQIYKWHKERKWVKSPQLWKLVYGLARDFEVTPSLMRRCLMEVGWIACDPMPNGGYRLRIRYPEPDFDGEW